MNSGVSRYLVWVEWRGKGSMYWGLWISMGVDCEEGRLKIRGGRARRMVWGMRRRES